MRYCPFKNGFANDIAAKISSRQKIKTDIYSIIKRYSIIDQHFKNNGAGLLSPPPFLCSQIITPFSHLMLSTNQERGLCI